jgi:hypothetical protein
LPFTTEALYSRDGNGSGSGWVGRKPDLQKNVVGLNLTPETAPTGQIWHPNLNPTSFRSSSGARRVLYMCFFWVFLGFYRVLFGVWIFFRVFFLLGFNFFRFLLGVFRASGFFQVLGAPAGENEICTRTRLCAGRVRVQPMGAKNEPEPASVGSKTHG